MLFLMLLCVFNVSNASFYIIYNTEMEDKKYGINFIVTNGKKLILENLSHIF
jgi:hypothetical protein